MQSPSLYTRLGGYDGIAAFADDLLPRLQGDPRLGRFWQHRGSDGIAREKQLLVDFLSAAAGGPLYYTGRDMLTTHRGMRIDEADWTTFLGHATETMQALAIPDAECGEIAAFVSSLKAEIVEA